MLRGVEAYSVCGDQNFYGTSVQEHINLRDRGANVTSQNTTVCNVTPCINTLVQPAASVVDSVHTQHIRCHMQRSRSRARKRQETRRENITMIWVSVLGRCVVKDV
jgi:hypothetical protein